MSERLKTEQKHKTREKSGKTFSIPVKNQINLHEKEKHIMEIRVEAERITRNFISIALHVAARQKHSPELGEKCGVERM
jgi:hypothetical protein